MKIRMEKAEVTIERTTDDNNINIIERKILYNLISFSLSSLCHLHMQVLGKKLPKYLKSVT